MSDIKAQLGVFIRQKRVRARMTCTDLGRLATTGKQVIQKLENGEGWYTKQQLLKILAALQLEKDERKRGLHLVNFLCGGQKKKKRSSRGVFVKRKLS